MKIFNLIAFGKEISFWLLTLEYNTGVSDQDLQKLEILEKGQYRDGSFQLNVALSINWVVRTNKPFQFITLLCALFMKYYKECFLNLTIIYHNSNGTKYFIMNYVCVGKKNWSRWHLWSKRCQNDWFQNCNMLEKVPLFFEVWFNTFEFRLSWVILSRS